MFRKIVAIVLSACFVVVMPSFFVLKSLTDSFLREAGVVEEILPMSYEPVVRILGEVIAPGPSNQKNAETEVRRVMPQKIYEDAFGQSLSLFFQKLERGERKDFSFDLSPIKKALQKNAAASGAVGRIEREIPGELKFEVNQSGMGRFIITFWEFRDAGGLLVALFSILFLGTVWLVITPPITRALRWVGADFLVLASLLGLIYLAFHQMFASLPLNEVFSPAQKDLLMLLVNFPLDRFAFMAFITAGVGVIFLGSGILLRASVQSKS